MLTLTEAVPPALARVYREEIPCRSIGPDAFAAPEVEYDDDGQPHLVPLDGYRMKALRRACGPCPALLDCLSWAYERPEAHDVWGGVGPAERITFREVAATARRTRLNG